MYKPKVFIIGEVGVNHDGDFQKAIDLTESAIDCGVDAIKYQLWDHGTFPEIENLRLKADAIAELISLCEKLGVTGFATAFDRVSIEYLPAI